MKPARGSRSSWPGISGVPSRIAFHYLRDAADADEAVQDAFVKAYMHFGSFREELPFEVWFTRILINGCLDRLKARRRRERWIAPPIVDSSAAPSVIRPSTCRRAARAPKNTCSRASAGGSCWRRCRHCRSGSGWCSC